MTRLRHKVGGKLLYRRVKHSVREFDTAMELEIWERSRIHKSQDKYQVMWYADLGLEYVEWKVLCNSTYKYMKDAKDLTKGIMIKGNWAVD